LLYIDGDADYYQPQVNPLSGAASTSDLAFATGRGPDVVADIEGRRPLIRDDDVVVFACRDAPDRERLGCQPLPADLLIVDRDRVRRLGASAAARQAVRYLTRDGGPADGFWIPPRRRCLRRNDHAGSRRSPNGRGLAATVREALARFADA
jgi:arginase